MSETFLTQNTVYFYHNALPAATLTPQDHSLSLLSRMFAFNEGGTSLFPPPKAFRLDQSSFGSTNRDTHGHMQPRRSAPEHIGWERATLTVLCNEALAPLACGAGKKKCFGIFYSQKLFMKQNASHNEAEHWPDMKTMWLFTAQQLAGLHVQMVALQSFESSSPTSQRQLCEHKEHRPVKRYYRKNLCRVTRILSPDSCQYTEVNSNVNSVVDDVMLLLLNISGALNVTSFHCPDTNLCAVPTRAA